MVFKSANIYIFRFFKIFPLLGQHQVGLEKYAKYLCSQVILNTF